MSAIGLLFILALIVCIFVLPIRAAIVSGQAIGLANGLHSRVNDITSRLILVQQRLDDLENHPRLEPAPAPASPSSAAATPIKPEPPPAEDEDPAVIAARRRLQTKLDLQLPVDPAEVAAVTESRAAGPALTARPLPPSKPAASQPKPVTRAVPETTLEQFMGVKLFAWLGGLALFFGIVFFVKYAFEHNLIPPAARIAIGYVIGIGLGVAGTFLHRNERYKVLAQTLCATGVLILYGDTFAALTLYHLFGNITAFAIMSLITAAAFTLAVKLDALVIAVLGMVGGFLTPILCGTREDNPLGLFGYIALLDIGLLAVVRVRKWFFLASLGATGTIIMQLAWFGEFFQRNRYDIGGATWTPVLMCSAFMVLFLIAAFRTKQNEPGDPHPMGAAMALCGSAMLFAFLFLAFPQITGRTWLLYGFVFFINACVLTGVAINPKLASGQIIVGIITFAHLACWTMQRLTPDMLFSALAVYFIFGVIHSVFPVVWQKLRPESSHALQGAFSPWFPPLALVLMLLPLLRLEHTSFIIWPAILLVDVLAIVVAVTTSILLPVLAALVITLGITTIWLFKLPQEAVSLTPFLTVVGLFAAFFSIAGCWLVKRWSGAVRRSGTSATMNDQVAAALPVTSAALPFALLIMVTQQLPVLNPTPVFAVGLALTLLLLGLARASRITQLIITALGCMLTLEAAWHQTRFTATGPTIPLLWYLAVYALFAVFPFVFRGAFRQTVLPWATGALSSIGHAGLVYLVAKSSYPSLAENMGLIPAAFAVPALASLYLVAKWVHAEGEARLSQLAWFGGTALLFITLIFPTQFHRQWITLGWALEGAALIWLFRRVPHDGLRVTGIVLLGVAFARLSLNPAVLEYQPHSTTPVFNWYFYTYAITAGAMFAGAWGLRDREPKLGEIDARAALWAFGGILIFWLLNIEIADCFTPANSAFTVIDFSGSNLARDMTYSIAWGLFALTLIIIGFLSGARGARYAGTGLLGFTLLKVFVHDLAALDSIYRIAALIGVALIALAASFLYQRFFEKTKS